MSLTEEQLTKAREMLESSTAPLIFYHDDPDGLCAFLILQRHLGRGHGIMVKASPYLSPDFIPKIEEYKADLVVVLDIAHIEDEFLERAKLPILWIDHHEPQKKRSVHYLNPRLGEKDENLPVSWMCHKITESDLWLGVAGCVSDWVVPPDLDEFIEKFPKLVEKEDTAPNLLFKTRLGTLIKVLSFNLKGTHQDVRKSISCLQKIKDPEEILQKSSGPGEFLWKKYARMNREYESILKAADAMASKDEFVVYTYHDTQTSLTKDLANEVYANHPRKTILLAREKSGKMMFSLRSLKNLPPALAKALAGLDGNGGGHEHACGGWIVAEHFPEMLERLRRELAN